MKLLTFSLVILLSVNASYAQKKRANHWYFGWEAGIDFGSGLPVPDTAGKLTSIEGCSSISDTLGNLLFYSNGETIWNKNHDIMLNGSNLIGNQSCVQSCLIVPAPKSNVNYYVFTNGESGGFGYSLYYSIVDMSLDGGNGAVIPTSKNIMLFDTCTEEIAGTMHCNATDYWIVARQAASSNVSNFYVYRLGSAGLSSPIIQPFNTLNYVVGNLSFSQDGSLLSFSVLDSTIFLFDFDTQNGTLSLRDSIVLPFRNQMVYSTAISPDNSKLYATIWDNGFVLGDTNYCYVSQFDLNSGNISNSRINLDSVSFLLGSPNGYGFTGRLQLAPDQRIYVSRWNQASPFITNPNTPYSLDSIDVVHNPNLPGFSCGFQRNFLHLNHKPTQIGLPNFVSNFTAPTTPTYSCTIGIHDLQPLNFELKIFPNPFSTQTIFQSNHLFHNATLLFDNLFGQTVKQIKNISGQSIAVDRGDLPSGMYIISIIQDDTLLSKETLLIID